MGIGIALAQAGNPAEGIDPFRKASDIMRNLADAKPANTEVQSYLADSYGNIGAALLDMGKPAEALEPVRKAVAVRPRQGDASPAATDFQERLGWGHPAL